MWIHKSTGNVAPENKARLIEMLSTAEVFKIFRQHPGFVAYYFVNQLENPQEMASITIWDSQAEGQDFYASPAYREVLSGAVPLLIGKPVMETFDVKIECQALIPSVS